MAVILRRDKGSTLTHDELDDNFQELLNRANLDSDIVKRFTLDSADAIKIIDSAYIEFRRPPEVVFGVSNNGTLAWRFNKDGFSTGVDNPTLYLQRGLTYKFEMNALGHPFEFRLSNGGAAYTAGVTGSSTQVGNIFFTPNMDAPNTLVYQCTNHSAMVGNIVILDNNTFLDSASVTNLIDSAYVNARLNTGNFLDSAEALALIDAAYIQSNQITYNTSNFTDSAFVTGLNVSTFTNDVKYLDSSTVQGVINSSYVNSIVTSPLVTGSGIGGGVNTTPLTHPVGSFMMAKVRRSVVQTYNTGATYPGIFPGDTIAGSNLYYQNGTAGSGYPAGIYNSVSLGSGTWKALAYVADTTIEGQIRIGGTNYDAAPTVLYQRVA